MLPKQRGNTYSNTEVTLDGRDFKDCNFKNCVLVYNGGEAVHFAAAVSLDANSSPQVQPLDHSIPEGTEQRQPVERSNCFAALSLACEEISLPCGQAPKVLRMSQIGPGLESAGAAVVLEVHILEGGACTAAAARKGADGLRCAAYGREARADAAFKARDGGGLREWRQCGDLGRLSRIFAEVIGDFAAAWRIANGVRHDGGHGQVRVMNNRVEIRDLRTEIRRGFVPGLLPPWPRSPGLRSLARHHIRTHLAAAWPATARV